MFGFGAGGGVDAIIATLTGITIVVFIGGVAYVEWYKSNVLDKIEATFEPGYDPALELANQPGRRGKMDEDALNKLVKVAIRRAMKTGRPLVLAINDDDGKQLLMHLQQRTERWAESGIVTMLFNTDDFWPYTIMRQLANRM
ncbi:hypothetical protein FRC07_009999 [Ceratobasidium sp. 392]|nr:hypothetical protein FRC07_009999 [Ceratobasidium sp. 392]